MPIVLDQGNTWTFIASSTPEWVGYIDNLLRYPSEIVAAKEAGYISPDDQWDGWVRLLRKTKTIPWRFPTGLLSRVLEASSLMGAEVYVRDGRQKPLEGVPDHPAIPLRSYQQEAVKKAVQANRGVIDAPPRSGKTRILCEIHRQLSLPTIWIAPTDNIVKQTVAVLEEFFGKNYAVQLTYPSERELRASKEAKEASYKRVVVCTAATAAMLDDEFFQTREVLIVDEFHHAGAKTYRAIFQKCDHIYFRFGATGTFFRTGADEMEMHGLLSNTVYKIDAKDLLEMGHLVPTRVVFVPVDGPRLQVPSTATTYQSGFGKHGVQEHDRRNQLITMSAVLLNQTGRKTLILVATKKQGYILKKAIQSFIPPKKRGAEFDPVEFVSTDKDRKVQGRILKAFLESEEVQILIGTSLLGEGTDLPNCDALVYAKGEKAEVTLTQNAYRVCTAVDGKKDAIIVDFADRHYKKLMDHSLERLAVYHDIPTFHVTALQSMEDFVGWLKKSA